MGSPKLITACPTCYSMVHHNLPEAEVETVWTLLDRVGLPEGKAAGAARKLAVHDSCTTRHERQLQQSVRNILTKLGHECEELPYSRDKTVCCGYGGLMLYANPEVANKVMKRRIAESQADYLAYCAMCSDNFISQGKRAYYLLDLLFEDRQKTVELHAPGYSQRQENRAGLKQALLREVWGEAVQTPQPEVRLTIPAEVARLMEDRMILVDDVASVIAHAERTGTKLQDADSGHFIACLRPVSVTYWVEYSPWGDGFMVHNTYSHRIEILEQ
jgi:hypothetical protein